MRYTNPLMSCFTYTLGGKTTTSSVSLYVPLTSRCNSITLPHSRGPNFLLPAEVVAALCRVRDAEHETNQWTHWCMWLDTQDTAQKLPQAQYETVSHLQYDLNKRPTVQELMDEINTLHRTSSSNGTNGAQFGSIVIGGEGEPTLRPMALLELIQSMRASWDDATVIRLTTNGLVDHDWIPKFRSAGLNAVSIALMTADAKQYEQLMQPAIKPPSEQVPETPSISAHSLLQNTIKISLQVGLQVELTAVDRPDVDKTAAQWLAKSLGVASPIRWRPYFP